MGELILLRHGETEWSVAGQHTGRTDIPLTPHGEAAAKALEPLLSRRDIVAVFTSPARRAVTTAAFAGLSNARPDPDLWEWDYGGYEGLTTQQVAQRTERVLARATPLLAGDDVALVAHGHVLRVLTACYLRQPPAEGRLFRLDTGTVSTLGTEHTEPVITSWNVPPSP
jgi:broad specificity phosphatase PhoE